MSSPTGFAWSRGGSSSRLNEVQVMNRFLGVSLLLGTVLATSWSVPGTAARAQGGGGGVCARANGDVDGDQEINLSDAIYLLSWLFRGGPAPVECPCSEGARGLPDTGLRTCYGQCSRGVPSRAVDCANATCPGQDGFYDTGCPPEGRFLDNGDGTVTDSCTGLMWQKETPETPETMCEAALYCEALELAGHNDWHLPNLRELFSLVDYGRSPTISPVFDLFIEGTRYWSSTANVQLDWHPTWWVAFSNGCICLTFCRASDVDRNSVRVRAVRGGL